MEKDKKAGTRSLREWYRYGEILLKGAEVEDAGTDAHILLEYAAHTDRSGYYLHMDDSLDAEEAERYCRLLRRRAGGEPVQYLTEEAWFCGRIFYVTPDVLIPRQDTEVLVEEAKKHLQGGMRVLDLCTGSGCILLSLVAACGVDGTGSDLSEAALAVAEQNRKRLELEAAFIRSDLFDQISGTYDMIVSNPPYIATAVLPELPEEVIGHEPRTALDGGPDGLDLVRRIIRGAQDHLVPGGWLLMEIGYDQGKAAEELLKKEGFRETQIIRDLEDRDRVAAGRRPEGADSF